MADFKSQGNNLTFPCEHLSYDVPMRSYIKCATWTNWEKSKFCGCV